MQCNMIIRYFKTVQAFYLKHKTIYKETLEIGKLHYHDNY